MIKMLDFLFGLLLGAGGVVGLCIWLASSGETVESIARREQETLRRIQERAFEAAWMAQFHAQTRALQHPHPAPTRQRTSRQP